MKFILFFIFISFCLPIAGQDFSYKEGLTQSSNPFRTFTIYPQVNVGYHYMNGSYFQAGAGLYMLHKSGFIVPVEVDINIGYMDDSIIALPEINTGIMFNFKGKTIDPYSENINASFWVVRLSASPYYIEPRVGFSILELIEIYSGYVFPIKDHPHTYIHGISAGIKITTPTQLFVK